jgi:hypothetical protein
MKNDVKILKNHFILFNYVKDYKLILFTILIVGGIDL